MICKDIISELERLSPIKYAESWDNVGLLVGRQDREVNKIMLALDATDSVISRAVELSVDMIITHHPLIFSPVKKVNDSDFVGNKILSLAENKISYYAMHTNFDIMGGMSELSANIIGLDNQEILEVTCEEDGIQQGVGRIGEIVRRITIKQICEEIKDKFGLKNVMVYGDTEYVPTKIAISPGSGKSLIKESYNRGCDLLITGDIGHHDGIDAVDMGVNIIDATHYGLEHIFMEYIHKYLIDVFKDKIEVVVEDTGSPMQIL